MGYISSDALKATLELTGETYADDDITLAIDAASEVVDDVCNRRFTLDPDNTSVRYYPTRNLSLIDIDDIVDVVEIAVGPGDGTYGTILAANTGYDLEPLNAVADSVPYSWVRLVRCPVATRNSRARMRITGQFGWLEVPSKVMGATTLLAGRLLKRYREAPFGLVGVGLDGVVARIAQTDPDICAMLKPVTRILVR